MWRVMVAAAAQRATFACSLGCLDAAAPERGRGVAAASARRCMEACRTDALAWEARLRTEIDALSGGEARAR